jgi:hypothetical protein
MIDENSHYSQHQPKSARKCYAFSLENVHPSKVFRLILSCPRTKPQEPRRPRFSFFYLHNVKERTKEPSPAAIVSESLKLSDFFQTKQTSLAGCPADQSASVRKRQQWDNSKVISVANVNRVILNTVSSVNTLFHLSQPPNQSPTTAISENPKTKITLGFQWLASVPGAGWRRALKR